MDDVVRRLRGDYRSHLLSPFETWPGELAPLSRWPAAATPPPARAPRRLLARAVVLLRRRRTRAATGARWTRAASGLALLVLLGSAR
jgi:hypothetical protein